MLETIKEKIEESSIGRPYRLFYWEDSLESEQEYDSFLEKPEHEENIEIWKEFIKNKPLFFPELHIYFRVENKIYSKVFTVDLSHLNNLSSDLIREYIENKYIRPYLHNLKHDDRRCETFYEKFMETFKESEVKKRFRLSDYIVFK